MSATDRRLDGLFPRLTALERATLVLQAFKDDCDEDPLVRATMPASQGEAFNSYMSLLNAVLHVVLPFTLTFSSDITALSLRWHVLRIMLAWGGDLALVGAYIALETREPITATEHARRVREARGEVLELRDAVDLVANDREDGSQSLNRLRAKVRRTITEAVQSRELLASRRGAQLRVSTGDLFDWLGKDLPVIPEFGCEFEVVPDEDAERVTVQRERRSFVQQVIASGPHASALLFPAAGLYRLPDEHLSEFDRSTRALGERIRSDTVALAGALWAVRAVLEDARAEFGGEDVALPFLRAELELAQSGLDAVHGEAKQLLGELALPETDEPRLERLRAAIASYRRC